MVQQKTALSLLAERQRQRRQSGNSTTLSSVQGVVHKGEAPHTLATHATQGGVRGSAAAHSHASLSTNHSTNKTSTATRPLVEKHTRQPGSNKPASQPFTTHTIHPTSSTNTSSIVSTRNPGTNLNVPYRNPSSNTTPAHQSTTSFTLVVAPQHPPTASLTQAPTSQPVSTHQPLTLLPPPTTPLYTSTVPVPPPTASWASQPIWYTDSSALWTQGFRPPPQTITKAIHHTITSIQAVNPGPWPDANPTRATQATNDTAPLTAAAMSALGNPSPAPGQEDTSLIKPGMQMQGHVLHVEVDASMQMVSPPPPPASSQPNVPQTNPTRSLLLSGDDVDKPSGPHPSGPHVLVMSRPALLPPASPPPPEHIPLTPEEERRRARRRHRKRLAALVVEHWKWFARYRLMGLRADRHYHHQLMGAGLVGLQSNVVSSHAHWRLSGVHLARTRYLMQGHMIKAWHQVAGWLRWLRGVGHQLALRHKRSIQRQSLHAWVHWYRERLRLRKMDLQGPYTHEGYLQEEGHQGVERGGGHEQGQDKEVDRGNSMAQSVSSDTIIAREAAVTILTEASQGWQHQALGRALRVWLAIARHRQALRHTEVTLAQAWRRSHLRHCMAALAGWAARQRELRLAAGVLAPLGRLWRLRVCWQALLDAVMVSQGMRTAEHRFIVMGKAVLRALAQYVHHRQRKRDLQRTWNHAARHLLQRGALHVWRYEAIRLRAKAELVHVADDAYRSHLLTCVMEVWKAQVQYARLKAQQWLLASEHHRLRMQHMAMLAWSHYHRWCVLKSDVASWSRRVTLSSVLYAWLSHAREQVKACRQWDAATKHWYLVRVYKGMHALREAVHRRQAKEQAWATSVEHHQHSLMLRAVLGWAHLVLPQAAQTRMKAARAAAHWRKRILTRALHGWQGESARLAIKHGKEAEADEYARHCRLGRALLQWVRGVHEQRERRVLKDEMLQSARRILGRRKAGRVLTAWHELHVQHIMEEFRFARAVSHHSLSLMRISVRSWRAATHLSMWKAHRTTLAIKHWSGRCLGWAWPAWREYVSKRRDKARAMRVAEDRVNRLLKRHALEGLRWYMMYRHQKASDLSAALAQHQQLLRREGVAQWLRVGLWRRDHRLQHQAAHQARALAVELSLVEPYARHWRRITHSRTAARVEATFHASITTLGCGSAAHRPSAAPLRYQSMAVGPVPPSMVPGPRVHSPSQPIQFSSQPVLPYSPPRNTLVLTPPPQPLPLYKAYLLSNRSSPSPPTTTRTHTYSGTAPPTAPLLSSPPRNTPRRLTPTHTTHSHHISLSPHTSPHQPPPPHTSDFMPHQPSNEVLTVPHQPSNEVLTVPHQPPNEVLTVPHQPLTSGASDTTSNVTVPDQSPQPIQGPLPGQPLSVQHVQQSSYTPGATQTPYTRGPAAPEPSNRKAAALAGPPMLTSHPHGPSATPTRRERPAPRLPTFMICAKASGATTSMGPER